MSGFGDIVQKAFYLGVGIASFASEKAGSTLVELRSQAQKLADEMVARGELTTEEAKRMVDDMVTRAQSEAAAAPDAKPSEPRRIEILNDDEDSAATPEADGSVEDLRSQVQKLQDELRKLQQ